MKQTTDSGSHRLTSGPSLGGPDQGGGRPGRLVTTNEGEDATVHEMPKKKAAANKTAKKAPAAKRHSA